MNLDIFGVFVSSIEDFLEASGEACLCGEVAYQIRYFAKGEDIHIRLNTEGGDVEGGKAIASAIRDYIHDFPEAKITIECEALVASAGANLLTQIPRTENVDILCHRDTQFMFHASSACIFGGADVLRDYAKSMDDYNAGIKNWLKKNTSLDEGKIDAWFCEGRMGWLNAQEALDCGLVNAVIEEESVTLQSPAESKDTQVAQYARFIRDAFSKQVSKIGEKPMNEEDKKEEEKLTLPEGGETTLDGEGNNPEAECPCGGDEKKEEVVAEEAPAEVPAPAEAPAEVEELKAKIAELEEKLKECEAKLAECDKEKETTEKVVAKLTAGLSIKTTANAPQSWTEVVKSIRATAKTQEAFDLAYCKAKVEYKPLFEARFSK